MMKQSSRPPLRVGVIGAGRMGKNHCRVFTQLRHAELVGVCERNMQLGVAVARQYEAPFYASVDEMLDHVDAVSVAVPTPFHFEVATQCMERGIHLFIEKPIAATVEEAEELATRAEASNLVVQVGHIERFNPVYAELKNVLEEMTPLAVNFRRLSPYAGSNTDVDVVLDLMIHDIDLVLDLLGDVPSDVYAAGVTAFSGSLDHCAAALRLPGAPLTTLTASRLTEQKVRQIEVTALEAYVVADLLNKTIKVHRSMTGEYIHQASRSVKYRQESIVEAIHVPSAEPLYLELQHFVDCVQQGNDPLVSARAGANALRVAMEIRALAGRELLSLATSRQLHQNGKPAANPLQSRQSVVEAR